MHVHVGTELAGLHTLPMPDLWGRFNKAAGQFEDPSDAACPARA
jgi:hypothetical protein